MNLALLTPEWHEAGAGGIATYCRVLAAYAARRGHQVTVIAAQARTEVTPEDTVPGVRVIAVPSYRKPAMEVASAVRQALADLIDAGCRPDVIEAAEFGGAAALIRDLQGAPPLVTRLHTPLALLLERNEGRRFYRDDAERCELESRQVAASCAVTSPSAWLAREAARLWRLPAMPDVIPNPIPWNPSPRDERKGGPLRVLYIGRLEFRKGAHVLAQAARLWLSADRGEVTFAGQDTTWDGRPMSEIVREAMGPFGEAPTCNILGRISRADVGVLLRHADLVVLPSLYENFSYACLESMVAGTPVIATAGSGFEEILDHGRTGFLVPPGGPRALASVLQSVSRAPSVLGPVAVAAQSAARAFSVDICGRKIVDHLQCVAAHTQSARVG
jgi:glycogen(starch) synthase